MGVYGALMLMTALLYTGLTAQVETLRSPPRCVYPRIAVPPAPALRSISHSTAWAAAF